MTTEEQTVKTVAEEREAQRERTLQSVFGELTHLHVDKLREIVEREKDHMGEGTLCFLHKGTGSYGVCIMGAVALDAGRTTEELHKYQVGNTSYPEWKTFGNDFRKYGFKNDLEVGVMVGVNDGMYDHLLFSRAERAEWEEAMRSAETDEDYALGYRNRVNARLSRAFDAIEKAGANAAS